MSNGGGSDLSAMQEAHDLGLIPEKKANGEAVGESDCLPCEFCGVEMSFRDYSTHLCDGLSGLNPLQEKLRHAKWRTPATVRARGGVVPEGLQVTPEVLFDPEKRLRRRAKTLVLAGIFGVFLMGAIVGLILPW